MPGYHTKVNGKTIHTGLSSLEFAKTTAAEYKLLEAKFAGKCFSEVGWVAAIEGINKPFPAQDALIQKWNDWQGGSNGTPMKAAFDTKWPTNSPPYRLIVVRPPKVGEVVPTGVALAYAHKIDICSGAGPMNVKPREGPIVLFDRADRPAWLAPECWGEATKTRKIVHGMDGLTDATVWPAKQRVGIYGAGGIGLNQVERARDVGCPLDWLATQSYDATVNLYRNFNAFGDFKKVKLPNDTPGDAMLDLENTKELDNYKNGKQFLPALPKWRFAINSKVGQAEEGGAGRLKLTANPANNPAPLMRDHFNKNGYPPNGAGVFPFNLGYLQCVGASDSDASLYDRIVLCIGQDPTAPGEPSKVTGPFGKAALLEVDSFTIGLQWENGAIRALGAAAVSFPANGIQGAANTATTEFLASLPVSAVVPGFIRAGWSIATANGYIGASGRQNANVNTAPEADLRKALAGGGVGSDDAAKIARLIVNIRMAPANGIASFDALRAAVDERAGPTWKGNVDDGVAAKRAVANWDAIEKSLSMHYPEPQDFEK